MKKLIYMLALTVGGLTACKKSFLEVAPESSLTSANFFKTEGDINQGLVACYGYVNGAVGDVNSWIMGEMRSDNTHYDKDNSADASIATLAREAVADFIDDDGNQVSNGKYYNCFTGISKTNIVLDRIAAIPMDQAKADQIIAEARFLRGLFYFELVRYYGGVPLYLHEVTNPNEAQLPRASADDVYAQIIEDAQAAVDKLPVEAAELGRASKAAAEMLLGYVYITEKKYAEAEAPLKDITTQGYLLLADYASVFDVANKANKELIFEGQYLEGPQASPSYFLYNFIPITANSEVITGHVNYNLNGGWNVPTPEMIATYESGDTRLDASIAVAEGTGPTGTTFTIESVKDASGYTAPAGKIGKPFIKKYWHTHAIENQTNDNWPVYRYSDALLLLAESLNEQGKYSDALPYLNQVRNRAFNGGGSISVSDQDALRAIIAHERRVELAFENKRWLDLVRTGQAIPLMTANGAYMKSLHPELGASTYNITENRLLFPIPRREVEVGKLIQNPGY